MMTSARTQTSETKFGSSISVVAGIMSDDAPITKPGDTAALAAFRYVARSLSLPTVVGVAPGEEEADVDELSRLAAANALIVRTVSIAEGLHGGGIGPLVAFRRNAEVHPNGSAASPVVLIRKGTRWQIIAAEDGGSPKDVSPDIERQLGGRALLFTRNFSSGAVSLAQLAFFGLNEIRSDLLGFVLMSLLTGLAVALLPIATGAITATVLPSRDFVLLWQVFGMIALIVIGNVATRLAASLTQLRIDGKIGLHLRTASANRVVRSNLPAIKQMPPALQAIAVRMIDSWNRSLRRVILSLTSAFLMALPSLFIMLSIAPLAGAAVFGVLLASVALAAWIANGQVKAMSGGSQGPFGWMSTIYESFVNLDTVRSTSSEVNLFSRWAEGFQSSQRRALNSSLHGAKLYTLQGALQAAILFCAIAVLAAIKFTESAHISITFVMATMAVAGMATSLVGALGSIGMLAMQTKMIRPILNDSSAPPKLAPAPKIAGHVTLNGITARRAADGPATITAVDFVVRPGEHVGLVGPSGSGKSTLLMVLLGLIEPDSGTVLFDDLDQRKLDMGAIRRQIGLVGQGSRLFAGSLRDNIKVGLELTDDQIWAALKIAEVDSDVRALGLGLSTPISDADPTLSGGQVQRILIARAVAAKPRLMILDEATSAIDHPTRGRITKNLEALGAAIISVAHRLETLVQTDRIYVLEAGRVVEVGGFVELVARGGVFSRLASHEMAA